jgi:hypothetical protein
MPRAALLHHLTPGIGSHYDWLLAPDDGPHGPDEAILLCFRVADRIDLLTPGQGFEAERIPDHRWLYLSYEGEISDGRGRVERVAEGHWSPETVGSDGIRGVIEWGRRPGSVLEGRRIDARSVVDRWRFQITAPQRR